MTGAILNRTCLRPTSTLRRQLIVGYGITALITVVAVVILGTIAAIHAGEVVKEQTSSLLKDQLSEALTESAFQTAGLFTKKMEHLRSSAALLGEIVRDRIVGYPDDFADDQYVSFPNMETGRPRYPLKGQKLPKDFEVVSNWNNNNLAEHAQERAGPLARFVGFMSTRSAFFSFQGNCDPSDKNPNGAGFFENCTAANNDASRGGMVYPTAVLPALDQKSADIAVFLKPLWEAEPNAIMTSVFFHNEGAGASLTFPSFRVVSTVRYPSAGCDWMRETNPYRGEPYGTEEQISKCAPAGTLVPIRRYNPMERSFCHDQVLHPGETRIYGPYLDSIWGQWRLTVGQAVFDRMTGHFIACTAFDLNLQLTSDLLASVRINNRTNVAITRLDGTVVAGAGFAPSKVTETINITETNFVDEETFFELTTIQDWDSEWDHKIVTQKLESNFVDVKGLRMSALPSPPPPDDYDSLYQPEFWIIVSARVEDVFGVIDAINVNIEDEVNSLIFNSVLIGLAGLVIFLLIVLFVSQILTRPLNWMEMTAWKIVNHADKRVSHDVAVVEDEKEDPMGKCAPKTEIRELVSEFQTMIKGFSGQGASRVAQGKIDEVKNVISWKEDFAQLYQMNQTMENKMKAEMKEQTQSFGRRISYRRRTKGRPIPLTPTDLGISSLNSISEVSRVSEFSQCSQYSEEESTTFRSADLRSTSGVDASVFGQAESSSAFKRPSTRTNFDSNIPVHGGSGKIHELGEAVRISRSSLFRWIMGTLVVPLLLTNVVICALVARDLLNSFPKSVETARNVSIYLETDSLRDTTLLRAMHAEHILPGSLRDLHLISRFAGWLLFGGVARSDSFTKTETEFVEECKEYSEDETCPFEIDNSRSPCDCEWNDPWLRKCEDFAMDTRDLQTPFFLSQARDFDPQTGERKISFSFPEQDYNAKSTSWWTNVTAMPGSYKGSNASGYETTYDRLRVISALSVASFPIYNYINNDRKQSYRTSLSSYVAFEADGALWGFAGCNYDFARYAHFKSTESNDAFRIDAELCPVGKYGYDPRCRAWYDDTKKKATESGDAIHVTAPYIFATVKDVGTSAISPLIDPRTGEFIGTSLVDLSATEIFRNLEEADSDFVVVIAPDAASDADTVVGPGHPIGTPPKGITDVVLPHDEPNSANRASFANVTAKMKAGITSEAVFERTTSEGNSEKVRISYAPVYARVLKPVSPDDFTRGAEVSQVLLYTVGVAKTEETLQTPFQDIENEITDSLEWTTAVYFIAVAVVTLFCILVTAKISVAATKPMMILLRVVRRVNAGRIEDDMPPLTGGSREVTRVYTSFAKLYKIVRMSNSSFFSGDYKWAHHIACDALKLFRKIGDEKAVAIACNNIGNTLLAFSVQCREKGSCLKVDGCCCVKTAIEAYDEAILMSTKQFESGETDAAKANFAQQLADRHFNRAMCLLHSMDDPCCPPNARETALTDLFRCREYDRGVQEFFLHEKLMFRYSDICFERLIRRLHGLAILFSIEKTVWQIWDVNELVDGADLMLQAAWDQENAPLFRDVSKVGRLQQLEGAVIGLELNSGKLEEAARLAMRMLVEDEFIIDSSFVVAADSVLRFMRDQGLSSWTPSATLRTSLEFRRMRKSGKRTALDMERCFVFCLELGDRVNDGAILGKLNQEIIAFYEEYCSGRDYVGLVSLSNSVDSTLIVSLGPKEEEESAQRAGLDTATRQVGGSASYPALPTAVNMVANAASSTTSDVFLIYVSDGSTWDERSFAVMQRKIKDANSRRSASIDVIAVGLEVEDECFSQSCRNLCLAARSKHSKYLSANRDSITDVFETAGTLISARTSAESNRLQLGLTMERF